MGDKDFLSPVWDLGAGFSDERDPFNGIKGDVSQPRFDPGQLHGFICKADLSSARLCILVLLKKPIITAAFC
jgi:hypothetical protein